MEVKISGNDISNTLTISPNCTSSDGIPCINPPLPLNLDFNSITSISFGTEHSIWITNDGVAHALGKNEYGRILPNFQNQIFQKPHDFELIDQNNIHYFIQSAVCGDSYTLYLCNFEQENSNLQLALSSNVNGSFLFLNNFNPICLYGGYFIASAIDSNGSVIIIDPSRIKPTNTSPQIVSLPNNKKAVFVVCLDYSLFALSNDGEVYQSDQSGGTFQPFQVVSELQGMKIKQISGYYQHCFAVTDDGHVYVRGSNEFGQLGLGEYSDDCYSFELVETMNGKDIVEAYAGFKHSLFLTKEGTISGCGSNKYGELMNGNTQQEEVFSPVPTVITERAQYCITAAYKSIAFISCKPPKYTPNQKIE